MKFIHNKEEEKFDCGITCVNSILKYYKFDINIQFIKDTYHKNKEYSLFNLKNLNLGIL
ncbi:hypothetical protein EXM36_18715 [Clostridium botulinum]|uniref:cysteine peptidase family C39 domain-containing protein n=1 Tax=Clostridium botulinum TaxID=1491 RepID=UPI000A175AC7|nr:cysteine peptidase family C39 domain-containing protein [Clostridium botulinum]HDR5605916.1 hypothetical protein [Bacillus anthracis]NEZ73671.1 hypothetical protein [Clostridium botulinum]NFA40959.1 hypothetical protein [Clostridium botulinum]NFA75956.1 hypothetical protein [Clostridium botulinum]NFB51200.1 hypothetical protein [Clostridium botulinum]